MSFSDYKYLLILFSLVIPITGFSQTCNCPAVATCNPCSGGITSLTLQYKGSSAALITVKDVSTTVYSQTLNPDEQFIVNGSPPSGKFNGSSIDISINGVFNVSIDVNCSLVFDPNVMYGSFKLISAISKTGGQMCCTANSGDTDPPVISGCPANITVTANSTECFAIVNWTPPTATDCALKSLTSNYTSGTQFPIGLTTVVYTATDMNNNTTTCSFTVMVNDVPPVVSNCPADITVNADVTCSAKAIWTAPTFTDNCGVVTVTSSHISGSDFPIGTTPVTYSGKDNAGNSTLCTFNVNVVDATAPQVLGCPSDITIVADQACQYTVLWTAPTFTDNCNVTVVSTQSPGDNFPIGLTAVTYTGTDDAGNSTQCKFNVLVKDEIAPIITGCPENIQLTITNSSGETTVDWASPTAADNCTLASLTSTHQPGDVFAAGVTEVRYSATDNSGNTTTCTFTITIIFEALDLEISSVVTPDGNGVNDEWFVANIEKYETNKVVIVDRWGSVVYNTTGYNNNSTVWDGRNTHGNIVPTGTYFFTISVRMGSSLVEKKGFVELIR